MACRSSAGEVDYLVGDQQGTAGIAIRASDLNLTQRYYDPYGNPVSPQSTTASSSWPAGNKGFVGGTDSAATGLTNLGARECWMWDLTVPGDNDHDFYVEASATTGLHLSKASGDVPVLVHNISCPTHTAEVSIYDSRGELRGANPGEDGPATYGSGDGTPEEKAQGPWKGGMATHTEARDSGRRLSVAVLGAGR